VHHKRSRAVRDSYGSGVDTASRLLLIGQISPIALVRRLLADAARPESHNCESKDRNKCPATGEVNDDISAALVVPSRQAIFMMDKLIANRP
jgi:hypothetical protein